MKLLLELSGEHPTLPHAEVRAILEAELLKGMLSKPLFCTVAIDISGEKPEKYIDAIMNRAAMVRKISIVLCESKSLGGLIRKIKDAELPKGTFAVRARDCTGTNTGSMNIQKTVGDAIAGPGNKVELVRPKNQFRVINNGNYCLCLGAGELPAKNFVGRMPQNRPFFSPVTLHPKLARTLVNLSRVKKGGTLLDPFCGTGGVLIEAGLMGARILGNDIQEKMVNGCRLNLQHYGLLADFFCNDIGNLPADIEKTDCGISAIATDPPYGRAATTASEDIGSLYRRTFEAAYKILGKGGYLAIVLPSPDHMRLGEKRFTLLENYDMRVHRSLTRYFCVYRAN